MTGWAEKEGAKVLSLFDGMACGMLALQRAGIPVDRYVAFEIEEIAVKTSAHNFPLIEHRGDVFAGDFTEFLGFDFLIGGSPCTLWSIAQKNNRETEASGIGWDLFCQYVRALREARPAYFIYENNESMAPAIRESITQTFGFDPTCINSALLSPQRRLRLYWVGKRNPDGTYSKVDVPQPEDLKIYLDQVMAPEDFTDYKGGAFIRKKPDLTEHLDRTYQLGATGPSGGQAVRVYDLKGKSVTIKSQAGAGGGKTGLYLVNGEVKRLAKSGVAKCQTIPSWYEFPVSDDQAISLMGNGWTVDVIVWLLSRCLAANTNPEEGDDWMY